MFLLFLKSLIGLASALAGSHLLVGSAVAIARLTGISRLVIGLTIVAYGTGLPELVTSAMANHEGFSNVALGNIIGSNIFNILGILGIGAMMTTLSIHRKILIVDIPIMVAVAVAFWLVSTYNSFGHKTAVIFLILLFLYTWLQWRYGADIEEELESEVDEDLPHHGDKTIKIIKHVFILIAGVIALATGSRYALDNSVLLARHLQMSELFIGSTLLAVGTSLPELLTTLMAAKRGHRDIAIGNIIGSNVFNILGAGSIAALSSSKGLPVSHVALVYDIPVMCAASLACVPFCFTGMRLGAFEGVFFVFCYILYISGMVLWQHSFPSIIMTARVAVGLTAILAAMTIIHLLYGRKKS